MLTKHVIISSQHVYEPAPCHHRIEKHVYVVNIVHVLGPYVITVLELNVY